MSWDLLMVLMLLGVCMVLFVVNKPRMDVVALMVIVLLPLSGVISVQEALVGFSDPNVILIALLFVIGEALVRTGVTFEVGDWLVRRAGKSEMKLVVLLMLVVAGLGSVMSSTGVVGIFIPVALGVARRLKVSPGRLMMPLSFAGLIGGMLTLVATPPNMVLDGALRQEGFEGFAFFSFTPLGLLILAFGIGYMVVAQRWLKGAADGGAVVPVRRGLSHFIKEYRLENRGFRLRIGAGCGLDGKRLDALNLRREHGANVVAVERAGRFGHVLLNPRAGMELRVGDVLLVDFSQEVKIGGFCEEMGWELLPMKGGYFRESWNEAGMVEVMIAPESPPIGKSVQEQGFRSRYGLSVVGLRRQGKVFEGQLLEEKLKMGDVLLVAGPWKSIRQLQGMAGDFIVLGLPPEVEDVAPARDRLPHALGVLALMVVLMVGGWVPNVIAGLMACLLMGLFRCVDLAGAYKSIHWQSLILIAGMIPFAQALESTGGVGLAVEGFLGLMEGAGVRWLLGGVFVMTALTSLFISNTATAVLMAPIALSVAKHLEVSPVPFAMVVAIAASAAFMTPVSSPVNTLVMGPGNYRFMDFVKVGVPFTLLVLVVTVLVVPWLFPL
ncbi:SLC13 family permease [Phragmitibacter flavus]|uniref:SLC13 family permease n=1 Tax=Phragmitibacter flavus TaxID=2576071 RepID=A0A5R8KBS6_9BACT|nr:SLC13 family permease [Phragmitibacter flavus]TLD69746.1 SLC13 family permease [Phragmitibacter flavus]